MPKILYISPLALWPPTAGGRQRSNLLYRALTTIGQVHTLCLLRETDFLDDSLEIHRRDFNLIGTVKPLSRGEHFPWRIARPINPPFIDRLAHNLGTRKIDFLPDRIAAQWVRDNLDLNSYDLIVGRHLHSLTKPGLLGLRPTILDMDDMPTSIYRMRLSVASNKTWETYFINRHLRQLETILPPLLAKCNALWVCNELDLHQPGLQNASVLPNIPWLPQDHENIAPLPPNHNSRTIITVGSFNYTPNNVGVASFLKDVWPLVRQKIPDAVFQIVGSHMSETTRHQWSQYPGVDPVGFVQDLNQAYEQSAFSIAHITYGGGTNIKVLESLAYGRTCVLYKQAHRGYENSLLHGRSVFACQTPQDMAEKIVTLLQNPHLRDQMAATGSQIVSKQFSFAKFQQIVADTIDHTLNNAG